MDTQDFKPIIQHNCCGKSTFSFHLISCPVCNKDTLDVVQHTAQLSSQPPPFSVLIKPTFGSFKNYTVGELLHVGISDSKGNILNFDSRGVSCDPSSDWRDVLSFPIPIDRFDERLSTHTHLEKERERGNKYHQIDNNCYDFAIRFLNFIHWEGSNQHTKESFVVNTVGKTVNEFESFFVIHQQLNKGETVIRELKGYHCTNCSKPCSPNDHFHCLECSDVDLCLACYHLPYQDHQHNQKHKMFPLKLGVGWLCDVCDTVMLDGTLFSCIQCDDYALCPNCFASNKFNGTHHLSHKTVRVILPNQLGRARLNKSTL